MAYYENKGCACLIFFLYDNIGSKWQLVMQYDNIQEMNKANFGQLKKKKFCQLPFHL